MIDPRLTAGQDRLRVHNEPMNTEEVFQLLVTSSNLIKWDSGSESYDEFLDSVEEEYSIDDFGLLILYDGETPVLIWAVLFT